MNRLLAALPVRPADPDRVLLGRFAAVRDEAAFAELLRRHGPMVWGVCRRQLVNPADAEDAFQAAFLVLARRADAVPGCVGAWLHRVAVLTCRNVRRANRRRAVVALPGDIAVSPPADRLDVDDLLNRLPERDRRAVVLCHLHGLTRTEAAKQLGIPEGTLSARLSRGLARLRGREAALGAVAVPAALTAATARAVGVWELTAAGLSPAATGAATGVLRMFWVKKLTAATAVVLAGLTTAGVGVGLTASHAEGSAAVLPDGWKLELPVAGRKPDGPTPRLTAVVQRGWVVAKLDAPDGRREWEVVLGRAVATPTAAIDPLTREVTVTLGRYFVREANGELRSLRERKPDGPPTWEPLKVPGAAGFGRVGGERLYARVSDGWLWVYGGPRVKSLAAGQPWWPDEPDRTDICVRLAPNDATIIEVTPRAAGIHSIKLRPSIQPTPRPRATNLFDAYMQEAADAQAGRRPPHPDDDVYWLTDDNCELLTVKRKPLAAANQPPPAPEPKPAPKPADPPPADKLPADWKQSVELKGADGKVATKLTARVEKGWVVARYDAPVGQKVWEVVLAQADRTEPPALTADQEKATVAVEYGKYFARDSANLSLRVLRQRKTDGLPAWPTAKPLVNTPITGQSNTLCFQTDRDWVWVTAGPFGDDVSKRRPDRADLCLRLDHTGRDGGSTGSARITAVRGGVNSIDHGDTRATDDGEVFVAIYRPYPPPPAPGGAKPAAPPPAAGPLAGKWRLTKWNGPADGVRLAVFALGPKDGGLVVVPPPGKPQEWGYPVRDVAATGGRLRLAVDYEEKPPRIMPVEGRFDPKFPGRVYGCTGGSMDQKPSPNEAVYAVDLEPATKDELSTAEAMPSVFSPGLAAVNGRLVELFGEELTPEKRRAAVEDFDTLRALADGRKPDRKGFHLVWLLVRHAQYGNVPPADVEKWVAELLAFADRYGRRYVDYFRGDLAFHLELQGDRYRAIAAKLRAEAGLPPAQKPDVPKPADPPPAAKPTPPAVDLGKLEPDLRKAFEETVPIAITVRDADGQPVRNATVSKNGTVGYAMTTGHGFHGHARTDAAGRYTVWFRTQPDTTVVVTDLSAEADGFVRQRETFFFDQVKAHPDKPAEWDFVLARGELLAGTVPAAVEKGDNALLLIRGPSFSHTEPLHDGKFRLWVPKGRYTLTAVLEMQSVARDKKLADEPKYSHGLVVTKSAVLRDVPSGRGDLVVK